MKVTVLNNQSLLDIAIQLTGDPTNAIWLAQHNDFIPSNDIPAGAELEIPEGMVNNEDIKRYYEVNKIKPATGLK